VKAFPPLAPVIEKRPGRWEVAEFRRVFRLVEVPLGDRDLPPLSLSARAGDVAERNSDARQQPSKEYLRRYWEVEPGDLVVNPMWLIGGSIGVSGVHGAVSPDYRVYRSSLFDPRFAHHLLRSRPYFDLYKLLVRAETTFDRRVTKQDFQELPVLLPPLAEQRAIAEYLDAETRRTDALIAKKQKLIRLLDERWGQYVRRELRASGRPVPLKRGWTVMDCKHRTPAYQPSGYPVVSPGDATPGRLDLSRCHRFVAWDDFADLTGGGRRPYRGDVIYSRNASIGIASYVDSDEPFCMGQDVCLITSKVNDGLFLAYALNSLGVDQLEKLKLGSTFSRVNISQILELEVPLPAPEAQHRVTARIDDRKRRHELTVGKLARQIDLISERRAALIFAAVTGGVRHLGAA
jgi:type I restriction enzyme, S subunit